MNQTILITGSSTGIGRATAKFFQEKGWNVIATMRTPEKEEELTQLENVLVVRLDVQDYASIENAVNAGIEKFGKIDVLLNNAGFGLMGTFESTKRESIQRQYDVNVFGSFDVIRVLLPHFRANKKGLLLTMSSMGGKMTFPLMAFYHSTKYALEGFSESLHYELAPLGITVKIIEPGMIATDFGGRSLDFQHDESLTEYNPYVHHVLGKFEEFKLQSGTSEMVAEVIYGAATDGSSQFRYVAGVDAEQLVTAQKNMTDEQFFAMMNEQLK